MGGNGRGLSSLVAAVALATGACLAPPGGVGADDETDADDDSAALPDDDTCLAVVDSGEPAHEDGDVYFSLWLVLWPEWSGDEIRRYAGYLTLYFASWEADEGAFGDSWGGQDFGFSADATPLDGAVCPGCMVELGDIQFEISYEWYKTPLEDVYAEAKFEREEIEGLGLRLQVSDVLMTCDPILADWSDEYEDDGWDVPFEVYSPLDCQGRPSLSPQPFGIALALPGTWSSNFSLVERAPDHSPEIPTGDYAVPDATYQVAPFCAYPRDG